MEIGFQGTHVHPTNGRLYSFDAAYTIDGTRVTWRGRIRRGGDLLDEPSGVIDIPDGHVQALAPQTVTVEIHSVIDRL